jgi:hypothetical protein
MGSSKNTRKQLDRVGSRLGHLQAAVTEFYHSGQCGNWTGEARLLDVPVPFIDLATHFLVTWLDWSSLFARWRYWYGSDGETFQTLFDLDGRCRDMAKQLAEDSVFRTALATHIAGELNDFKTVDYSSDAETEDLLDPLLWGNDMASVAALMASASDAPAEDTARDLEDQLKSWTEYLYTICAKSKDARIAKSLSYYKRTRLLFTNTQETRSGSFLEGLLSRINPTIMTMRDYTTYVNAGIILDNWLGDLHNCLNPILTETGYSSLIDDILDSGMPAPVAGMPINLIPGTYTGACNKFLVAFSRGSTGPLSFATVLAKVRSHLIRCSPAMATTEHGTIAVVVFCDHWDAEVFKSDFYDDFAAFAAKGVEFVFELAASPRTEFTQINVKFK